ncbi:MAG: hypothetical protein J5714_00100 [Alphaproteobacteria bacterium]|nr:hypothetical protein [Alphaproteobacteria bacterium]
MKQVFSTLNPIAQKVKESLLGYSYMDEINPNELVSNVLMSVEYADTVKQNIQNRLKIAIDQDIKKMSVATLYAVVTDLFIKSGQRIPQSTSLTTTNVQNVTWNRTGIFSYIFVRLRELVKPEHNVKNREFLSDLRQEHQEIHGNTVAFDQVLRYMETKFGIAIDPKWTVGQLGNAAEASLIIQGKAYDPRSCNVPNKLWGHILDSLHLAPFLYNINNEFGVNMKTATVLGSSDLYDLEKTIYQKKIFQQIREILVPVLQCPPEKIKCNFNFVKYFDVTSGKKEQIKNIIMKKFGVDITGDFNTIVEIADYFPPYSPQITIVPSMQYVAPKITIWCKQK